MISCKESDYITISVLPGTSNVSLDVLLQKSLKSLYLSDLWDNGLFEFMTQTKFYAGVYRYADIQVKISYIENFSRNGISFEFSGRGLDYYREFLSNHNTTLRSACRRFVALSSVIKGIKTTSSRFDVAFDEIILKDDEFEPLLTIDRVMDCIKNRAFVTKFRKSDATTSSGNVKPFFVLNPSECDEVLPFNYIVSQDLSTGMIGRTVELGRRKSNSFVRIYDKLAEQSVKGNDVSKIKHWTRFEIEFKHSAACSVFMLYCTSKDDVEFADNIRGKALELVRFVDLDRSRVYNCTVCQWWVDFLNGVEPYHLVIDKPSYNKYIRALNYQKKHNAASFATLLMCSPANARSILLEGLNNPTKTSLAIKNDYDAVSRLVAEQREKYYAKQNEKLTGLDFWRQFYDGFSDDEFYDKFQSDVESLIYELEYTLSSFSG